MIPNSYDQQVPSTSQGYPAVNRPHTPLGTCMGYNSMPSLPNSPYRSSNPINRVRETCAIRNRAHLNDWIEHGNNTVPNSPCGPPSVAGSEASYLSTGSAGMSQMTLNMSQISGLTVKTQMSDFCHQFQLQAISRTSSIENQPNDQGIMTNNDAHQVIQTLSQPDPTGREYMKAINYLKRFRVDPLLHVQEDYLKQLMGSLYRLVGFYTQPMPMITELLQVLSMFLGKDVCKRVVDQIVKESRGWPIHVVCGWIAIGYQRRILSVPFKKHLLLVFYLMIVRNEKTTLRIFLRYAQDAQPPPGLVMSENLWLMNSLMNDSFHFDDPTHMIKSLALSLVRVFIRRDPRLIEYFVKHGGLELSLANMDTDEGSAKNDEKVMYQSCHLIHAVLQACILLRQLKHCKYAEKFIQINGVQKMASMLSHGSTRILHESLNCIITVSHVEALRTMDMAASIASVMQMLGTDDPVVTSKTVQFLSNVSADLNNNNNTNTITPNKKVILAAGGIMSLMKVLVTKKELYQNYTNVPKFDPQTIHREIRENGISCLMHLTNGTTQEIMNARMELAVCEPTKYVIIDTLEKVEYSLNTKQKAMHLLHRILLVNEKAIYRFVTGMPFKTTLCEYPFRIAYQYLNPINRESQKQDDPHFVYTKLVPTSIRLLREICKNAEMRQQTAELLASNNNMNPLYLLAWMIPAVVARQEAPKVPVQIQDVYGQELLEWIELLAADGRFIHQVQSWISGEGHAFLMQHAEMHPKHARAAQSIANLAGMPLIHPDVPTYRHDAME